MSRGQAGADGHKRRQMSPGATWRLVKHSCPPGTDQGTPLYEVCSSRHSHQAGKSPIHYNRQACLKACLKCRIFSPPTRMVETRFAGTGDLYRLTGCFVDASGVNVHEDAGGFLTTPPDAGASGCLRVCVQSPPLTPPPSPPSPGFLNQSARPQPYSPRNDPVAAYRERTKRFRLISDDKRRQALGSHPAANRASDSNETKE